LGESAGRKEKKEFASSFRGVRQSFAKKKKKAQRGARSTSSSCPAGRGGGTVEMSSIKELLLLGGRSERPEEERGHTGSGRGGNRFAIK